MRSALVLGIAAGLVISLSTPTMAQSAPSVESSATQTQSTPLKVRADEVLNMLNGELAVDLSEVFSEAFLTAVPPQQLDQLATQMTSQFGRAVSVQKVDPVDGNQAALEIRMEQAIAKGMIAIDPTNDNKVIGLRFTSFDTIDDSLAKIEADLAALPGAVNAYFAPLDMGDPVISIGADQALALGSTIKLYVLAALGEDIANGDRSWDEVVALTAKSFPSGMMQDWPAEAPVTLHTLASMMISISDNTATDQLIEELGRKRIVRVMRDSGHSAPDRNDPLMTTLDLFELKGGDPELIEAWRNGDNAARASILDQLSKTEVTADQVQTAFSSGPNAIDIEWFATPRDLANLFKYMRRYASNAVFPIMAINSGLPKNAQSNWDYIGYKGGSEPGVLNFAWLLQDKEGEFHILTLGWNNPDAVVDESTLSLIAQRILSLPRD